ncbi:galactose mutarotase [Echinicola sediminis]
MKQKIKLFQFLVLGLVMACGTKGEKAEGSQESPQVEEKVSGRASNFQDTVDGKPVSLYTLSKGDMKVEITNFGARIVSLEVPGKDGQAVDVVLGYNTLEEYLGPKGTYHGAIIGRYGNRIAKGKFSLDGQEYELPVNNGENHLHGGPKGFHNVVWEVEKVDESSLTLNYLSEDGEQGYPGNLQVQVKYALTEDRGIAIDYWAKTDERTPVNLTNHAFFNLSGEGEETINDHVLKVNADHYVPVDEGLIPLGEIAKVEGTPFDFRQGKAIGEELEVANEQLKFGGGYDHNFVIKTRHDGQMAKLAEVVSPKSGIKMEIISQEPGLQFYGGNFMDGTEVGKSGKAHVYRGCMALETQHFPDSPNQANFPSTVLSPGEIYKTKTVYKFSVEK